MKIDVIRYDVFLDVDFKNKKYKGNEVIEVDLKEETNKIILNSKDINITIVKVNEKEEKFENKDDNLIIYLSNKLKGNVKIYIEFNADLRNYLGGFYVSTTDENTYFFTTQFEPSDARTFIPCFDEPIYKAKFKFTVKVSKDLDVIFNTLPEKIEENAQYKIFYFKETPRMSTYLLYLGVGKFYYLEDKYRDIIIRYVVTSKDKLPYGKFALDWTKRVLEYFENYSGIKYPLEKLDLIAVKDFQAGAMENWGAITFRESLLIYNPEKSSESIKYRIMEVIAHELWHQWSGNLVTMKSWDDLWLNESFATYMAYKAIEKLENKNIWELFVLNSQGISRNGISTKIIDMVSNTHPVKAHDTDIPEDYLFDAITYEKGGNILRLLDNYLGEENFRKAVSRYLDKYKYSNADLNDFLNELVEVGKEIGKEDVYELANQWITKKGFPLVQVSYNKNTLVLKQTRFLYKGKENRKWFIPLFIKTDKGDLLVKYNMKKGKIVLKEDPKFIILNNDAITFSVFHYDNSLLEKIGNAISEKSISSISRFNLLQDMYLLSLSSRISIRDLLKFMKYYKNEDNWMVLRLYSSVLYNIYLRFFDIGYKKLYKEYEEPFAKMRDHYIKNYNNLKTFEDFSIFNNIIQYYSMLEDDEIISLGFELFNNAGKIRNDLASAGFYVASMFGGYREFKKLEEMINSKDPELVNLSVTSLSNSRNEDYLIDSLDLLKTKIRPTHWRLFFASLSSNPIARDVLLDWLEENRELLLKYKDSALLMTDIVSSTYLIYFDDIDRVKDFFDSLKIKHLWYVNELYYEVAEIFYLWRITNKNKIDL